MHLLKSPDDIIMISHFVFQGWDSTKSEYEYRNIDIIIYCQHTLITTNLHDWY